MAKFPVESSDSEGIVDGLNYLLSGPGGLGQNFSGFSSYTPAYLTGNYRIPFSQPDIANLYVAPIDLGTNEMLDGRTWKFTFLVPQISPPFSPGNGIRVINSTSDYNGSYTPIGVVECTTTYVIARTSETYPIVPPVSGGKVLYKVTDPTNVPFYNSTDCDSRVTTTGATDRVFISSQLDNLINYEVLSILPATMKVFVAINRYVASLNSDPTNPDYLFDIEKTIALKTYTFSGLTGTGTLPIIETVFATVLDQPPPAYYRYILEVSFNSIVENVVATSSLFGLRSISSQVVKQ